MSDQENPNANASLYSLKDLAAALPPRSTAFSPTDRAGMVNALKDRLQHLAGQPTYLESLSPNVKKRVQVLQDLQHQHDEIEARFHEEKAALELKYQKLYEPFYVKRAEIVNGQELEGKDSKIPKTNGEQEGNEKGVPEFWLTAMKTNEILSEQITEKDEGALKYLKDIKSFILDDPKGFRLNFYFDSNSYFKNTVLSKTYHMVVDDDEPILERAIGTEIDWNPGNNLTQKVFKKKPKKGAKNVKPVTKTEQCDSFFNFFSPPQVPEDDENIVPDEADQLQDVMEQDYDVGSTIKDKIIPHAVSWFTGEALQEEDFEDDPYDDEGEDEEDEDEETDDEDEEEENDDDDDDDDDHHHQQVLPKRNVAASKVLQKKFHTKKGDEQRPECKQQ